VTRWLVGALTLLPLIYLVSFSVLIAILLVVDMRPRRPAS
jgi:hypothetical protein